MIRTTAGTESMIRRQWADRPALSRVGAIAGQRGARIVAVLLLSALWATGAERPNIVLIYADDLDADEIACTADAVRTWPTPSGAKRVLGRNLKAGSPKILTPHIDSLAATGMLFTRFYVNATVCTASRYCLLTGRHATRGVDLLRRYAAGTHATLGWEPAITREETSLPKELRKLGYRTGIIGKWHNMPRGIMPKRNKKDYAANATLERTRLADAKIKTNYRTGLEYLREGFGWDVVDRMEWGNSIVNLDWQCEGALEFLEESRDRPFFLYCALPVPHGQYRYPYNQIGSYDKRVTSNGLLPEPVAVLPANDDVFRRTEAAGIPGANAMATRMDDYVGAVLAKLAAVGVRENTIVIFTSDHGSRGKNSCFEGGAKVPMLVSWPKTVPAGTQCDSLIGNVDIAATLLQLAGGTPPADMTLDSRSFLPQLRGEPEPADWRGGLLIEAGNTKAVVTREWKYVANRVPPATAALMRERPRKVFWSGVDHHNYGNERMYPHYWDADQLYDLRKDLYETTNLARDPRHAAVLEAMRTTMADVLATLPHTFGELRR